MVVPAVKFLVGEYGNMALCTLTDYMRSNPKQDLKEAFVLLFAEELSDVELNNEEHPLRYYLAQGYNSYRVKIHINMNGCRYADYVFIGYNAEKDEFYFIDNSKFDPLTVPSKRKFRFIVGS